MKKNLCIVTITISLLLMCTTLFARITVVTTKGSVVYKSGRQWLPLRRGMNLQEGTKVSTGVHSQAVIRLDNHTVTVNPLTMIKIYENKMEKLTSKNRIGLRRGSIRARVSKSKRIRTIFKVSTPVATSSVRGTEEEISYGPAQGMTVRVLEGSIWGENKNGSRRVIQGNLVFHQKDEKIEPEPLIDETREEAVVTVFEPTAVMTKEEKESNDRYGDEAAVDVAEGPLEILDAQSTTQVNIHITFPP